MRTYSEIRELYEHYGCNYDETQKHIKQEERNMLIDIALGFY